MHGMLQSGNARAGTAVLRAQTVSGVLSASGLSRRGCNRLRGISSYSEDFEPPVQREETEKSLARLDSGTGQAPGGFGDAACSFPVDEIPDRAIGREPLLDRRSQRTAKPTVLRHLEPKLALPARHLFGKSLPETEAQRPFGPPSVVEAFRRERETQLDELVVEKGVPAFHRERHRVAVVPFEQTWKEEVADFSHPPLLAATFECFLEDST